MDKNITLSSVSFLVTTHKWIGIYNIVKKAFGGTFPGINNEDVGTIKVCEPFQLCVNQFNSQTVIGYRLPVKSGVSLQIYDMAGRLLASLVNRGMHAGYHRVKWNTKGVAPAVYFVNLKSGEQSILERMVAF